MYKRPKLELETTTLWDYPSQHYGEGMQGDKAYKGATPSYVIWNLLQRFTREGDVVLDPMSGSGTTLDVAADLGRKGVGFDLAPYRSDIGQADARRLPLKAESVDFVFVDPPYSTHLRYSGDERCIGELDAEGGGYYEAMDQVIAEIHRVLRPGRHMALYVQDSFRQGRPFQPLGFELFMRLRQRFEPVDIVAVTRRHKTLKKGHWHRAATEGNYYLRGFNYLFIMRKPGGAEGRPLAPKPEGTALGAATRERKPPGAKPSGHRPPPPTRPGKPRRTKRKPGRL